MTPAKIAERVRIEADARFGETIERLLSILETAEENSECTCSTFYDPVAFTPRKRICPKCLEHRSFFQSFVAKWTKTGLLDAISEDNQPKVAILLEERAVELIGSHTRFPNDDDYTKYVTDEFMAVIRPWMSSSHNSPVASW